MKVNKNWLEGSTPRQMDMAGQNKNSPSPDWDSAFGHICEAEGITPDELDGFFGKLMESTESQIKNHQSNLNHLTVLNRQLRAAAAVFLLVASGALLMSCAKNAPFPFSDSVYYGPYELAAGNKLVP